MTWIQTYSGVQFWPLDPQPQDVKIEDIAHALANTCRFGGHCSTFYSVAQHSVLVSEITFCEEGRRIALLHDAAEAYLPDVCRPIKDALKEFKAIETRVLEAIFATKWVRDSGLSIPIGSSISQWFADCGVKFADDVLLATEARDLMGEPPEPWVPLPLPILEKIIPVSPAEAKRMWLDAWQQINGAL